MLNERHVQWRAAALWCVAAVPTGALLLLVSPPADPASVTLDEVLVALPLGLTLPVALLIAVWPLGRQRVPPVGLSRAARIIGPWAVACLLGSGLVTATYAVGPGPVWAVMVSVTTTGAFAAFFAGQYRVRASPMADEVDHSWPRTPGAFAAGTVLAIAPALAGMLMGEREAAILWFCTAASFTFFGVYGTPVARGLEAAEPVAIATSLIVVTLLGLAVLRPGVWMVEATLGTLALLALLTAGLELITRPALAAKRAEDNEAAEIKRGSE